MKIKSILSGSAFLCTALLTGSLILSAQPLAAETSSDLQQQLRDTSAPTSKGIETEVVTSGKAGTSAAASSVEKPAPPALSFVATAYSLRGRTASGKPVAKGVIAADPRVLPLGSLVRLEAGNYSGDYIVADTGGKVRGRRIDIWTPTAREAMRFGRRTIKVTVLTFGGKRHAVKAAVK